MLWPAIPWRLGLIALLAAVATWIGVAFHKAISDAAHYRERNTWLINEISDLQAQLASAQTRIALEVSLREAADEATAKAAAEARVIRADRNKLREQLRAVFEASPEAAEWGDTPVPESLR